MNMTQTKFVKGTEPLNEINGATLVQAMKPKAPSKLPSGMLWWMPFLLGIFLGAGVMDYVHGQVTKGIEKVVCK